MLWLIISILPIFTVGFYYYCIRPMSYWKRLGIKQSNPAWLFGDSFNITLMKEGFPELLVRLYQEHPNERYSGLYRMTLPSLMIKDPDLIKQITVKDFDNFMDHLPFVPEDNDVIWGKGILSLKGQDWKEMRSLISPCFTGSKMKTMFHLITELSLTFVKYFKEKGTAGVVEVEMQDALSRFSNDVIASVAFGLSVDSLKDKNNKFYLVGKEITSNTGFIKTVKLLGFLFFPKIFNILKISIFEREATGYFYELVDQTIKIREEKGIVRPDVIHLLLEARKQCGQNLDTGSHIQPKTITNFDIAAQAFVFFFAGFDSVSNTMAFMASELAINPDIQNRLWEEIEETHKECNGQLTYDGLMKMKYMDMVVSETLRKWPNFPSVDRLCTKDYTIEPVSPNEKPAHVKKGDNLLIPIWSIHRDPKYYPEPEKFDPERFSEENKQTIKTSAFLPFGTGPRFCIGSRLALMEIKTLFYYLLLHFELIPTAKTTIPKKLAKTNFAVLSEGGHWLGLKVRQ